MEQARESKMTPNHLKKKKRYMISVALKLLGGKISLLINSAGSTGDTLGRDKANPNLPSHGRINCTEIRNLHVRNETYTSQKKACTNLLQRRESPCIYDSGI